MMVRPKVPQVHLVRAAEDALRVVRELSPEASIEDVDHAVWRADYLAKSLRRVVRDLERAAGISAKVSHAARRTKEREHQLDCVSA